MLVTTKSEHKTEIFSVTVPKEWIGKIVKLKQKMKLFLTSFAIISAMMTIAQNPKVFAQDPFTIGNSGDPFAVGGGGGGMTSHNNITLQVRSDTDWSGSYGSSSDSTSTDGQGNKDIKFACDTSYSANFQKKSSAHATLTLNIIQNESNPAFTSAMNNSTALNISNNSNVNASMNYSAKVQKEIPMDKPQITNTQTTIAEFGTV